MSTDKPCPVCGRLVRLHIMPELEECRAAYPNLAAHPAVPARLTPIRDFERARWERIVEGRGITHDPATGERLDPLSLFPFCELCSAHGPLVTLWWLCPKGELSLIEARFGGMSARARTTLRTEVCADGCSRAVDMLALYGLTVETPEALFARMFPDSPVEKMIRRFETFDRELDARAAELRRIGSGG